MASRTVLTRTDVTSKALHASHTDHAYNILLMTNKYYIQNFDGVEFGYLGSNYSEGN